MPDYVNQPISGPEAFRQSGGAAAQSQAALLLLLGRQLRGDDDALVARAAAADMGGVVEAVPADDLVQFPVPEVQPAVNRIGVRSVQTHLAHQYGRRIVQRAAMPETELSEALGDLAQTLFERPDAITAAQLMEASLRSPDELTRVAAAAAYFELSTRPKRLINILVRGTHSRDMLVCDVAATALARIAPDHARLRQMSRKNRARPAGEASHSALLVHGTFARAHEWWQPGGSFHSYLKSNVRSDLYAAPDRFEWSGGYSDAARDIGARDLRTWAEGHSLLGLDLFGHSHGANVIMQSTKFGLSAGALVLLSCPVHVPKYLPDFARTTKVVSIRVHLDLVILADRGGQRFRHPQIHENVLPIWFDHGASHNPQVWRDHNVPAML
jgi:hypothetical protein